jgi:AcrR family transcriptional regulator
MGARLDRPLPRGRHGLSRDDVRQSQHDRMVRAMTDAVAAKGYAATSVADVLRGAGVSRETFYQQFSDKLDCFMSAFEEAATSLIDRLEAAATAALPGVAAGPDEQFARFERGFDAYIEALTTTDRAMARVFLVEVHAAGPDAVRRRAAFQQVFVDRMAELLGVRTDRGRFACEVYVSAVSSMVTVPLIDGDDEALRRLRDPILDLVRQGLDEPLNPPGPDE